MRHPFFTQDFPFQTIYPYIFSSWWLKISVSNDIVHRLAYICGFNDQNGWKHPNYIFHTPLQRAFQELPNEVKFNLSSYSILRVWSVQSYRIVYTSFKCMSENFPKQNHTTFFQENFHCRIKNVGGGYTEEENSAQEWTWFGTYSLIFFSHKVYSVNENSITVILTKYSW